MEDLNDLFAFAKVVQYGGFSAAARALHVTKSSLSKRVARLEERYGARLIERSTRGFRVTQVGRDVHAQCETVVAGAEGAAAVAAEAIALPKGNVRVACPPGLLPNILTPILPGFMAAYPEVRLALAVSNRRVDLVEEGFDVALRVRERLDTDQDLVVRQLGVSRRILVADPTHLGRRAPVICLADLPNGPLLTTRDEAIAERWTLWHDDGGEAFVDFTPRLATSDLQVLLDATLGGIGIALLPEALTLEALATGSCCTSCRLGARRTALSIWSIQAGAAWRRRRAPLFSMWRSNFRRDSRPLPNSVYGSLPWLGPPTARTSQSRQRRSEKGCRPATTTR